MRSLLFCLLAAFVSSAFAQSNVRSSAVDDEPNHIALGDGLEARIEYIGGVRFLILPGREKPVGIPLGVYIKQAVMSPDRLVTVFALIQQRPDSYFDYFGCLVCDRSDTTAKATWRISYSLLAADLLLRFDARTWVDSIHSVTNDGIVTLKLAQADKQAPPSKIFRTWEEWNLFTQERGKKIRNATPFDIF